MIKRYCIFPLLLTLASCTHLDNYMLGKDNTPKPSQLNPLKEKVALSESWSIPTGSLQKSTAYSKIKPLIFGNNLYTADANGLVQAVDKKTGKIIWRQKLNTALLSGPSIGNGYIAFGTGDSKVLVLKLTNGLKVWEANVSGEVLSKPLIAKDKIIVKTIDGNLIAYTLAEGKKLWTRSHGAPNLILKASSSPVLLDNSIVLVGHSDGKMDAIDINTGRILWQRSIAFSSGASDVERLIDIDADPIVQGKTVFLGSYQGYIGALSLETGQFIWRKPASIYKNMLIHGDTLYATDSDDIVWSINKYNGQVNWKQVGLKFRGLTEPALVANRLVLGDKTGYLHVLSSKTGNFLSRKQIGASIMAAPTVADNAIYIATANGKLERYSIG